MSFSGISVVYPYHNPNEGREIWNQNFSNISSSITSSNYWTGSTGTESIIANNGTGNLASGNYSIAVGYSTTASGLYSHAGGVQTTANGEASLISGASGGTVSGTRSVILGGQSLTNIYDDTLMTQNLRAAENGGVIYSGGTDLYNIFLTSSVGGDTTRVQPGTNTQTGGTGNLPTVNLVDSPSFNNITFSGTANGGDVIADSMSATTLSASTLYVENNLKIDGQAYSDIQTTLTPAGLVQTINWNDGNGAVLDLASATGNVTLTFSNPKAGATYTLKVIQDAAAPLDLVYPANVKWQNGVTPVISTGASAIDLLVFFYDGTNYLASINQNY